MLDTVQKQDCSSVMGSTQRESSIGSSMFIPNWVRNMSHNSGFDPNALSPPMYDGEFLHLKFPEHKKNQLKEQTLKPTIPVVEPKPKIVKAMGIDEGFKGESCGASLAVAQQMVSGKHPIRGFTTDDANDKPPTTYMRQRRNSKSLPASPLASPEASPRTRRKNTTDFALRNRFFAGFTTAADLNESEENLEKKSGSSWILSGLFSKEAGLNGKNQANGEERETTALSNKTDSIDSISAENKTNLNVLVEVKSAEITAIPLPDRKIYRKKRSEIRELNFMSPVSM